MKLRKNSNVEVQSYKLCRYPDEEQQTQLSKIFRYCRYLWNRMLSDRIYECPICESMMDREQHSAIDIRVEGIRIYKELFLRISPR